MRPVFKRFKKVLDYLKLILPVLAITFIVHQGLLKYSDFDELLTNLNFNSFGIGFFFLMALLLFINLSIETIKWQYLMEQKRFPFFLSLTQVFKGATCGFFTPNRSGDFYGRNLHLPAGSSTLATSATITCNLSQLTVTVILGSFAVLSYSGIVPINHDLFYIYSGFIFTIFLLGFLNPRLIYRRVSKIFISKKLNELIDKLQNFTFIQRSVTVLLSALRYMIFALQYCIIIYQFGFNGSLFTLLSAIFLVYFITSILPSTILGELGVRESVALLIIGPLLTNPLLAVLASLTLWFINILIPAAIGAVVIAKLQYAHKNA